MTNNSGGLAQVAEWTLYGQNVLIVSSIGNAIQGKKSVV